MMAKHHPVVRAIQACGIAGLLSFVSSSASAAGFALIEQSVSSMGTAYAGAGSISEDASTVFFNPASMARLEGSQLSAGLHIVLPDSDFKGTNSYNATNPAIAFAGLGGISIPPVGGSNGGEDAIVPHFTYVHDYNEKLNFGFSVNAPFGLATKYSKTWAGRYSAIESEIVSVNLNPTVSFKIDEHASVGFGLNAMYASLELKNAIDDGLLSVLNMAPLAGWFPGSSAFDRTAKIDAIDDWGFGFNFGILLEPTDHTRLGLSYRSKIDLDLDGDLKSKSRFVPSQSAKVDVSLPDNLLLSAYHEITPKYAIMADVQWTKWSKISELKVKLGTGSTNTFDLQWEDTVRVAIGGSYKFDSKWTLRTGVAYDESPTRNQELRLAALPDDDRIWLSFGAGYKHSDKLSVDFGYAHLFIDDPKINSTDADSSSIPGSTGLHRLTGEFDADVDILSAQVNWKF
ncbi:MAG: outer membrane protein transport protein [Deltaproteobacteria bacterium]|nr:outer membrane protein transport protein [Deltaproteobacteria bacterium]